MDGHGVLYVYLSFGALKELLHLIFTQVKTLAVADVTDAELHYGVGEDHRMGLLMVRSSCALLSIPKLPAETILPLSLELDCLLSIRCLLAQDNHMIQKRRSGTHPCLHLLILGLVFGLWLEI